MAGYLRRDNKVIQLLEKVILGSSSVPLTQIPPCYVMSSTVSQSSCKRQEVGIARVLGTGEQTLLELTSGRLLSLSYPSFRLDRRPWPRADRLRGSSVLSESGGLFTGSAGQVPGFSLWGRNVLVETRLAAMVTNCREGATKQETVPGQVGGIRAV